MAEAWRTTSGRARILSVAWLAVPASTLIGACVLLLSGAFSAPGSDAGGSEAEEAGAAGGGYREAAVLFAVAAGLEVLPYGRTVTTGNRKLYPPTDVCTGKFGNSRFPVHSSLGFEKCRVGVDKYFLAENVTVWSWSSLKRSLFIVRQPLHLQNTKTS